MVEDQDRADCISAIPEELRRSIADTFSQIKPTQRIARVVDQFLKSNAPMTVGVQLSVQSDAAIQECVVAMQSVVDRDANAIFFVSCNGAEEIILSEALKGFRIVQFEGVEVEENLTSMERAWCELLLLSRMQELIITHKSKFGEVAWWMGGARAAILVEINQPKTVHRPPSVLHIIVQPYNDPHPDRHSEIFECLSRNLEHPAVHRVHALLEPDTTLPEEISRSDKLVTVQDSKRLTFANAFEYANRCIRDPSDVVCILNADVYLDSEMVSDVTEWRELCRDNRPRMLTRWEKHPDGRVSINCESGLVQGTCFDAWICPAPVPLMPNADFRVGNQLGCDERMVAQFVHANLFPVNDAVRFPVIHLDKCQHRGRNNCSIFIDYDLNKSAEETKNYDLKASRGCVRLQVCGEEERKRLRVCDIWRNDLTDRVDEALARQKTFFGEYDIFVDGKGVY
jgi:hypothetical protein